MATQFSAAITASSVSHDRSEIILICWFCAQETFCIIISVQTVCSDFLMDGNLKTFIGNRHHIFKGLQQLMHPCWIKLFNVFPKYIQNTSLWGRFKYIFPHNNQIYPVNFASKVNAIQRPHLSVYNTASFLKYLPILPGNLKNSHSTSSQNYGLSDDCCWLPPSQMHICFLSPCLPTHSLFISYILCKDAILSSPNFPVSVDCSSCPTFCSVSLSARWQPGEKQPSLVLQADWTSVSSAL